MAELTGSQRGGGPTRTEAQSRAAAPQAPELEGNTVAAAQRTLGNQVVQRLADQGRLPLLLAGSRGGLGNQAMQVMLRKLAPQPPAQRRLAQPASLPRPMLPPARFIQRFNAAADDARKPTTDVAHPAVLNLALNNLGPYTFNPMYGTFNYRVTAPGGPGKAVGEFLQQLLKDRDPAVEYDPEKMAAKPGVYNWKNPITNANFAFHPGGVQPAVKAKRVAKAKKAYLKTTVAYPAGKKPEHRAPGKVLDAMKSHGGGNAPRPFVSIAQEDALGAPASHNQSRHVVGGADMPDETAVAVRAAFGLIGGLGGKGAMYSSTASAFQTVADANMDIGNAINTELTNNWKQYRVKLITQGGVTLKVPRAGGQIVAFKSTKGAKWGAAERPKYLDGASAGLKPLFDPDPRYDAWALGPGAAAIGANYAALKTQPLTKDVAGTLVKVNVRIVSSTNPNAKGWVINSAYPTI